MFKNTKRFKDSIMNRTKEVITLYKGYADAKTKKVAEKTIKNFSEGIKNDTFGLQRLKPETIKQKQRMGYPKPSTPLYGKGGDRSYSNMLMYRKLKSGIYRIRPSERYHHKAGIPLRVLFIVHEHGMVIDNGKALIFIPSRPALQKSVVKTRLERGRIKNAIITFLNKGINIFKRMR